MCPLRRPPHLSRSAGERAAAKPGWMAMVGMAGITEDEQPHTSLAGVARGATALWVDGTAKDFAAVFGSGAPGDRQGVGGESPLR